MSNPRSRGWVNDTTGRPHITGRLEISKNRLGIFIGGDPDGLRSFAKVLTWLANVNQEAMSRQPIGERCHIHLHANDAPGFSSLTPFSCETELCRLDAKGTGEFPERYRSGQATCTDPTADRHVESSKPKRGHKARRRSVPSTTAIPPKSRDQTAKVHRKTARRRKSG